MKTKEKMWEEKMDVWRNIEGWNSIMYQWVMKEENNEEKCNENIVKWNNEI